MNDLLLERIPLKVVRIQKDSRDGTMYYRSDGIMAAAAVHDNIEDESVHQSCSSGCS